MANNEHQQPLVKTMQPEHETSEAAHKGYRRLWAAVLIQALRDWCGTGLRSAPPSVAEYEYHMLASWLGSKDFIEVCWLAGVEPEMMMKRFLSREPMNLVRQRA